jgi:glycine cleavage system aminomethyltransferase T
LKKMIALATVTRDAAAPATRLQLEVTVDHKRQQAGVAVAPLPFFDPPRKRA